MFLEHAAIIPSVWNTSRIKPIFLLKYRNEFDSGIQNLMQPS